MQSATINDQNIEAVIIAEDGTEAADGLTPEERDLLEKIDAALQAHAGFAEAYAEAQLVRIDSNRGLGDREEGRFYLRYRHSGGMAEFWGNVGDKTRVDMRRGIVGVPC